jgi:uncharacterized membrane protein
MSTWSIEPIFSTALVVAIAAALIGLLALSPRFGKLSPRRRGTLLALRVLVILLVLLAMLRPTRVFTSSKPRPSVFAVMFDTSRSMQLPDRTGGPTRFEAQRAALARVSDLLPQLGEHTEVRVYGYDAELRPVDLQQGRIVVDLEPQGDLTDIGATLNDALQRETGKRISGVLLIGDGTQTAFNSPVESAAAARRLRDEFAAPLYATPLGPAGDTAQAKDVAIERLDEQYTVFVKNEVVIRGRMKVAGYANQPIGVEMLLSDSSGRQESVGRITKTARLEGEGLEFEFPYIPQTPGHFKITVRADAQPGELVTKNNELSAYLTVLEGGLRVLLIDSGKRPEFKFLRRSLNDSPDIDLDDLVIDSLNRGSWPVNLGNTLKEGKYDVFILGNVPADALGPANMQELAKEVENGKGLLAIGGVRTFGAGNYFGTPLANVFPIVFDRFEKQDFDSPDRADLFHAGPIAIAPTGVHAVTRLAEGPANVAAWERLPPLDFANRFTGIKPSPGVRVLLAGPNDEPLLVSGEYGRGRTLAFAGESTYRWPLQGFTLQHKRFWRQSILWLARRDESEQSDVWVKLQQRRFLPGSNVTFTLGARTPEGETIPDAQFTATLTSPEGTSRPLRIVPMKENWSGALLAKLPGDYAIDVVATRNGEELGKTRAEFFVFDQDVELSNAAADHDHLARLASITKEFGGRIVPAEELSVLLQELISRPPEMEVRQQKWRMGDGPATAWLWLLAFAGVLGTEWWLRKRWGMV